MNDLKSNVELASSSGTFKELEAMDSVDKAPKTINFSEFWQQLFKEKKLDFPLDSETAWGFDLDEDGKWVLSETNDGLSRTGNKREVGLDSIHTLEIHTEPGYTKESLAAESGKFVRKIDKIDLFKASLPKNYLYDVDRLLRHPEMRASMIIRMDKETDLWAISFAVKTDEYKQPSDADRVVFFGNRFGYSENLQYNLSFDKHLKKFGVAVYRGFVKFPPEKEGDNYLRKR